MGEKTGILWTDATWNPVTGCSKVSQGCQNCYAEKMALRLRAMGSKRYEGGFEVRCHEDALGFPRKIGKPSRIFVNSMSDLLHEQVPVEFLRRVFDVMRSCPRHAFQVLTKRADRIWMVAEAVGGWPKNVWMGVTVERGKYLDRMDYLRACGASLKFVSVEPLVGPVGKMNLDGIGWVIVGGESGPNARPMDPDWVRDVRDQCKSAGVPFLFKQWGEWAIVGQDDKNTRIMDKMKRVGKKEAGRLLDGVEENGFPMVCGRCSMYVHCDQNAGICSYLPACTLTRGSTRHFMDYACEDNR